MGWIGYAFPMKARRLFPWSIALCAAMLQPLAAQQMRTEDFAKELNNHQYQKVLADLETVLPAHPHDPLLWTVRGLALRGLGQSGDSITDFEKALQVNPNYIPALEGAAETAYDSKDPRAPRYVSHLLKLQPANETANAMAGVLAYEQHHCASALGSFEKSKEQTSRNEIAVSEFSDCLLQANRSGEAVRILTRALSFHPDSSNLRFNLAVSQMQDHRPEETLATLRPLSEAENSSADVLNLLAAAQIAVGKPQEAAVSLSKAISVAPAVEGNYVDLAVLCLENQQYSQALQVAASGLQFIPTSWQLYTVHGMASSLLSRYEDAEADFEKSLQLEPLNSGAVAARSVLYAHTDQPAKAIAVLRQKLRSSPADSLLNYLLADALIRGGAEPPSPQFEEARRAVLESLRGNPNSSNALTLLGKIYIKDHLLEKAEQTLKTAAARDPTNRAALNQLLVVSRKLGRREEAVRVTEQLTALINKQAHPQRGVHTGDDATKTSE